MLMKLTPVVNFINILHANFLNKSFFSTLSLALNQLLYEKSAHKMLMKLTPGDGIMDNLREMKMNNLFECSIFIDLK